MSPRDYRMHVIPVLRHPSSRTTLKRWLWVLCMMLWSALASAEPICRTTATREGDTLTLAGKCSGTVKARPGWGDRLLYKPNGLPQVLNKRR